MNIAVSRNILTSSSSEQKNECRSKRKQHRQKRQKRKTKETKKRKKIQKMLTQNKVAASRDFLAFF